MNEAKSKKKIIFFITGSDVGGAEVVVKNLIFNIDPERFIPILLSMRPLGRIGSEIKEKFRVASLEAENKFNPLLLLRLFSFIKKEKPDILHCHLFHANFLGRIIGSFLRVPLIISTVHSDNFGGRLRYFLLKITDCLNDVTIAVSKKIKDDLVNKKISPERKTRVIYNGINKGRAIAESDTEIVKNSLGIEFSKPIILSVGRLNLIKGHIYLIRAVEILKAKFPGLKLLLVGDGPERKNLELEVNNLGLNENVLFLGEKRDLGVYYGLADIFVLPSVNEGFGLTVVEAMSNKLLVVATRVGGVPEIINDGVNGFLVETKNENFLASVITKALSLESFEKEKLVTRAYEDFLLKFSLVKMRDEYISLYSTRI